MVNKLRIFVCSTLLGRVLFIPYRAIFVVGPYWVKHTATIIWWLFTSKEFYNHSARISKISEGYMGNFIANISSISVEQVDKYFNELLENNTLRQEFIQLAKSNKRIHAGDILPNYGRRIAWYAFVRIFKPKFIIETGVDGGLGTAVICEALRLNILEGNGGHLVAIDTNPNCGYLIPEDLRKYCSIVIGNSIVELEKITNKVDMFIHDSDHRTWYEYGEYHTISSKFHEKTLVLSDNSRRSEVLKVYADNRNKKFAYFQEELLNHWWPGDGIGVMYGK